MINDYLWQNLDVNALDNVYFQQGRATQTKKALVF